MISLWLGRALPPLSTYSRVEVWQPASQPAGRAIDAYLARLYGNLSRNNGPDIMIINIIIIITINHTSFPELPVREQALQQQ